MTDIFEKNKEFLKENGIILKESGLMFTPYEYEDDRINMTLDEYSGLSIRNNTNGKLHVVCMATQLIDKTDLFINE